MRSDAARLEMWDWRPGLKRWIWTLCVLGTGCPVAHAGGPRFVTGMNYSNSGYAMAFYTSSPAYYTDPGDLSVTVTHAQADAMVAAAAATWNVPTSSLVLAQGGELAEHVSGANTYFDGSEMVFPPDVSASNWQNIPIAVIYDTDGSVIDALLGEGASDPSGCRQTGVLESVDSFGSSGTIQHAMIILNGLCVGSNPDDVLQMQYQVERAFGRVLGLAWSQLNDNIFTGATPPNTTQMSYWPIMHPIDVLCGEYTYQCMTNPFQLRPDDLSALAMLYPVMQTNAMAQKVMSSQSAVRLAGVVQFPTGQGMGWVNITVTRALGSHRLPEPGEIASGVTGYAFQQNGGNPITGPEADDQNVGSLWTPNEGLAEIQRVPDSSVADLFMNSEEIDPLYTDEYAIAPYQRPPVTPSGSPVQMVDWSAVAGTNNEYGQTPANAASSCPASGDGTQVAPAASDPSGWWTGLLCSVGHSSWWNVTARAGRSWTVEVTALDESGAATMLKAQPVIGIWNVGDTGLPTVASAPFSMNAWAPGVTQVQVSASASAGNYMFAVADQFGGGRPDFAYKARFLYADRVSPVVLGADGGEITITGEGFQQGNQVMVNGVAATVVSLTATQIVARAPSLINAGASAGTNVDVTVMDNGTGGVTTISGGISYAQQATDVITLVSAPGSLETGVTAATPLEVRLLEPDGVTPLAAAPVQIAVSAGAATFGACGGGSTCTLQTNAAGEVQTTVTGGAPGEVVLSAIDVSGGVSVEAEVMDTNPVRAVAIAPTTSYVAAGATAAWSVSLTATQDGAAAGGAPIVWTATNGLTLGAGTQTTTDGSGVANAVVQVSGIAAGTDTVTGCGWSTVCASWTLYSVAAPQWTVAAASGAQQSVEVGTSFAPVQLLVTDEAGHPLQGAPVTIYQTVDAWEGGCPAQGACPASAVLSASKSSGVSDANGFVTVTPLQIAGMPQTVNIAAVTGTQGFVAVSLVCKP
jgi:hypothetical protein